MRQKKSTRKEKVNQGTYPTTTKKWSESYGINEFKLNQSQLDLANKIRENDLVFCEGVAGSGKTLAVLHTFVNMYLRDNTKEIIIIRSATESGLDKIGALPDSLEAKIEPHFASSRKILEELMTKGKVDTDLGNRLHFKIPNFMLGATLDNSLTLIDEAQVLPPLILKLLLERIGRYSKVVVAGDNSQLYTNNKGRNALLDAIPRFFKDSGGFKVAKYDNIAYHKFTVEDVVRSELVKNVIRAYS